MGWIERVLNVFRPGRVSNNLDREISFHIAEAADRLVERGMDRQEAIQEATNRFGASASASAR